MAVLDSIKNTINFIGNKNNTTSSGTASNTSSNTTQKKTGFWSKFLSALKAFFVGKQSIANPNSNKKTPKPKP